MLVTYEAALAEDYVRELMAVAGASERQWALTVGVLSALAGAAAVGGGTPWGIVGGLLAFGVSVLHFGSAATVVSRAVRESSTQTTGTFRFRLDEDGISVESDRAGQRYGWAVITSARSARHGWHFYAGRRIAAGLPFVGMTAEQLAQVLAVLVERDLLRPRLVGGGASATAQS
jgi:hypothetical protein